LFILCVALGLAGSSTLQCKTPRARAASAFQNKPISDYAVTVLSLAFFSRGSESGDVKEKASVYASTAPAEATDRSSQAETAVIYWP